MRGSVGASSKEVTNPVQWSPEQRTAVIEEMDRILDAPVFKTSKRCVDLLRHLFEHALAGSYDGIKERTLGVEVFGRKPNYDTGADAIVRQTAGEIRKRLAQCYQEPDRSYPVKIHLVPGRYILGIEFASHVSSQDSNETEMQLESPHTFDQHQPGIESSETVHRWAPNFLSGKWAIGIAIVLLVSAACVWVVRSNFTRSTDYMLWKPLLESRGQVIVCVADSAISATAVPPDKALDVPYTDANVANMITNKLSGLGTKTTLRLSSELTLDDLRQSPSVLVGSFNNRWSMTLLSNLRYTVKTDPVTNDRWIEDAQAPSKREWMVEGKQHFGDNFPAYVVVSRFMSPETRQWAMTVVGLNGYGTEAAGEFISNSEFVKYFPASMRSQKNLQIVLQTNVINGSAGPPQVLAVYTW